MRRKKILIEAMMTFLVCTACICIMEGVVGMVFLPEQKFGYEAFFSPPLFGFFSTLFSFVLYPKREEGAGSMLIRKIVHLAMIEAFVLGLNYLAGADFEKNVMIALVCAIAIVYAVVSAVMYISDRRSAEQFNEQLKQFQEKMKMHSP